MSQPAAVLGLAWKTYRASVIGNSDYAIRLAVFAWLTERRQHGELVTRRELETFALGDRRIPLVGPSGIWKPAACDLPLSITTTLSGPYSDAFDVNRGTLRYAYRGTEVDHRDNRGLRTAMTDRVPLVYLHAVAPGQYVAAYPVFVVGDDPKRLMFEMQVDDVSAMLAPPSDPHVVSENASEPRRAYVTSTFRRRLHQVAFRERVLRAYRERCALCRLGHTELLDAAHITPDSEEAGIPTVSNGLSLCKLHHAAFDGFFFAIRPDYVIDVRPSLLAESDGPMLVVGLQQIHGRQITLPKRHVDLPDRDRLAARFQRFLEAS
jgi:putative restriction endonuclease